VSIFTGWDSPADNDVETESDVECPACGTVTPDACITGTGHGSRSYRGRSRYSSITWGATCDHCGHEWEWDDDLTDE
jgi:hypothetical protein